MATVNFSVPDEVKEAFDKAFADQNKSAIVAELMRRAVEDVDLKQRRMRLVRELTNTPRKRFTSAELAAMRKDGRP